MNLAGSLSADNIAIHRIDGVKGDVSVIATAYAGNISTEHDDRGITMEPGPIRAADYRNIEGNLRVRFVRTDLTVGPGRAGSISRTTLGAPPGWPKRPSASTIIGSSPRQVPSRYVLASRAGGTAAGTLYRMRCCPACSRDERRSRRF